MKLINKVKTAQAKLRAEQAESRRLSSRIAYLFGQHRKTQRALIILASDKTLYADQQAKKQQALTSQLATQNRAIRQLFNDLETTLEEQEDLLEAYLDLLERARSACVQETEEAGGKATSILRRDLERLNDRIIELIFIKERIEYFERPMIDLYQRELALQRRLWDLGLRAADDPETIDRGALDQFRQDVEEHQRALVDDIYATEDLIEHAANEEKYLGTESGPLLDRIQRLHEAAHQLLESWSPLRWPAIHRDIVLLENEVAQAKDLSFSERKAQLPLLREKLDALQQRLSVTTTPDGFSPTTLEQRIERALVQITDLLRARAPAATPSTLTAGVTGRWIATPRPRELFTDQLRERAAASLWDQDQLVDQLLGNGSHEFVPAGAYTHRSSLQRGAVGLSGYHTRDRWTLGAHLLRGWQHASADLHGTLWAYSDLEGLPGQSAIPYRLEYDVRDWQGALGLTYRPGPTVGLGPVFGVWGSLTRERRTWTMSLSGRAWTVDRSHNTYGWYGGQVGLQYQTSNRWQLSLSGLVGKYTQGPGYGLSLFAGHAL